MTNEEELDEAAEENPEVLWNEEEENEKDNNYGIVIVSSYTHRFFHLSLSFTFFSLIVSIYSVQEPTTRVIQMKKSTTRTIHKQ